ncbi:MAG TPA: hypothetical protein VGV37_05035 [Aliidongia sp.]|uniref:hypothetical protein n=1 Tax=Aliidongia sp. TaxID=1914230 RepID=UPI002DDD6E0A|nr:hypothetical protein [Aliidongia sp.]HEV2673884.1 hypothetical protein [Aliidongia sp.]
MASEQQIQESEKPVVAGRAPDGVAPQSRAAYEAGMRDRAKIADVTVDPDLTAAVGPSEGAGGGGNVEPVAAARTEKLAE